jgi:23S rRNA (cytosine1962-C5)-methyltransferase
MQIAVLNRTSRLLAGHLWVFSNELASSPKKFMPGTLVELQDKKANFLGIGYVNPHSLISIRILTRKKEAIDGAFIKKRIEDALSYRKRFLGDRKSFRAVYSEGDLLPGLIVDKYEDCLSVQFLTLGMEAMSDIVLQALEEVFSPSSIVLRNDNNIRTLEGIPLEKKITKGSLDTLPVIDEFGMKMEIDPMSGQKTGFFLDQAENRAAFSSLASGGVGLDLFCYTGAWSLALAGKGVRMKGVDSSDYAVGQAKKNADLNGLKNCEFVKEDVFEAVKAEKASGRKYECIVLDPPAFVKSKTKMAEALKAYRELNNACMGLLKYKGLFATSSCSYHVERAMFLDILRAAARDAGKQARVIETRSQAKDHPAALTVPETEYLKCVLMEVF